MNYETGGFSMLANEEQEPQPGPQAEPIETLLERYEKPVASGWLIKFHELPDTMSAYNASDVFLVDDEPHMIVRVEEKGADKEFTSTLGIYRCSPDLRECWLAQVSNLPELTQGKIAQDPAIAYVNDKWVVTWVEVTPNDPNDPTQDNVVKSVTYIGDSLDRLGHLVDSPETTKGVRFVGLLDGRIGVFTRPYPERKYKICFTVADSWEDINTEFLAAAEEIEGMFVDSEWGGVNDAELLANGDIDLLMHLARFMPSDIPGNREYYSAFCVVTPGSGDQPTRANYLQIIATAEDFRISPEELQPKRADLNDVVHSSALIIDPEGGEATLLTGLRDGGEAGIKIPDPLKDWRADHPEFADNPFPYSSHRYSMAA